MRGSTEGPAGRASADSVQRRALRLLLAGFAAVSGAHLAAQLLDLRTLADSTQVLLMPLLAGALLLGTTAPRGRLVRLVLVGLVFSWVGDSVPRFLDGDAGFLAMLAGFLVAQVLYAVAFWPLRRVSVLGRPVLVAPYLVAAAAIVVLCAPGAGPLLPGVAVYAAAIVAMAVLATGLGRLAGLGAAVFVASDALIALNSFGVLTLPGHGVWVMGTYIAAQGMLVLAVHRSARCADHGGAAGPLRC